ncbi:MAG: hypothetical protein C0200_04075 [Thermoproteota archaeon]|nr:MAG: hypothetical protein C0200_04075 [Candidatus Korarchaeota archaeon]
MSYEEIFRYGSDSIGPGMFQVLRDRLEAELGEDPFKVLERSPKRFLTAMRKIIGYRTTEAYFSMLAERLRAAGIAVTKDVLIDAMESDDPSRLELIFRNARIVTPFERMYRQKVFLQLEKAAKARQRRVAIGSALLGIGMFSLVLLVVTLASTFLSQLQVNIALAAGAIIAFVVAVENYLSNTAPAPRAEMIMRMRILGGSVPPLDEALHRVFTAILRERKGEYVDVSLSSLSESLEMSPVDLIDSIMMLQRAGVIRVESIS